MGEINDENAVEYLNGHSSLGIQPGYTIIKLEMKESALM